MPGASIASEALIVMEQESEGFNGRLTHRCDPPAQ